MYDQQQWQQQMRQAEQASFTPEQLANRPPWKQTARGLMTGDMAMFLNEVNNGNLSGAEGTLAMAMGTYDSMGQEGWNGFPALFPNAEQLIGHTGAYRRMQGVPTLEAFCQLLPYIKNLRPEIQKAQTL